MNIKHSKIIVEKYFQKEFHKYMNSAEKTKRIKQTKVRKTLYKLSRLFLIILALAQFLISLIFILDTIVEHNNWLPLLDLLVYIFVPMTIVVILGISPFGTVNRIYVKNKFDGLENYFVNAKKNTFISLKQALNIECDEELKIKIFDTEKTKRRYLLSEFNGLVLIAFFMLLFLGLKSLIQLYFIDFVDDYMAVYIKLYLIMFSVTFVLWTVYMVLVYNSKSTVKNSKVAYNFELNRKFKRCKVFEHLSARNEILTIIYDGSDENIITIENYKEYINELVELIPYELIAISDQYIFDLCSINTHLTKPISEALEICSKFLSRCKTSDLEKELEMNVENYISISDKKNLVESIECNSTMNALDIKENYYSNFNDRVNLVSGDDYGRICDFRVENYNEEIKFRSNKLFKGISFSNRTQYDFLDNRKYFSFQIYNERVYALSGATSIFYSKIFDDELLKKNSYRGVNAFQFVLNNSEDSLIKVSNGLYRSNSNFKNQMFYENKLILSEEVKDRLIEYIDVVEINIEYQGQERKYYICTPKKYSNQILDEDYSIRIEEYGSTIVKNSRLLIPCIKGEELNKYNFVGVKSYTVSDYNLSEHNYNIFIFDDTVYNEISKLSDLKIIKHQFGYSKHRSFNRQGYVNAQEYKVNVPKKDYYLLNEINNNSYRTQQQAIMKSNNILISKAILLLMIIILSSIIIGAVVLDSISKYFENLGDIAVTTLVIERLLYIIPLIMMLSVYNYSRKYIFSPTRKIEQGQVIQRLGKFHSKKLNTSFKVHRDDLVLAVFENRIVFELPIDNKQLFIENEVYYNNSSFGLYELELDLSKAILKDDELIHEINEVYYLNNESWKQTL